MNTQREVHHCALNISALVWNGQTGSCRWAQPQLLGLLPACRLTHQSRSYFFRGKRGRICWPSLCVHPQELPSPLPPRKNQWHLHPHTRKPKQPPLAPDLVLKALILAQEQSKPHTQLTLMHVHTHTHTHMPVHTDENGNPSRSLLSETSQPRFPNRGVRPAAWAPTLWSHHVLSAAREATCGEGAVTGGYPLRDQVQSSCPCTVV